MQKLITVNHEWIEASIGSRLGTITDLLKAGVNINSVDLNHGNTGTFKFRV